MDKPSLPASLAPASTCRTARDIDLLRFAAGGTAPVHSQAHDPTAVFVY